MKRNILRFSDRTMLLYLTSLSRNELVVPLYNPDLHNCSHNEPDESRIFLSVFVHTIIYQWILCIEKYDTATIRAAILQNVWIFTGTGYIVNIDHYTNTIIVVFDNE